MRRAFIRENLLLLVVVSLAYVAIWASMLWWQFAQGNGSLGLFTAGAATVGYGWGMWAILEEDGTRRLRRAALSEELTSKTFRRLRSAGWYVVDRIEFRGMDVDHVAVGPGGVLAIETKHTMVPWKLTANSLRGPYRDPVQQAKLNARKVRLLLKSEGVDVPVVPALVVRGRGAPTIAGGSTVLVGVVVLCGPQAEQWRPELLAADLDAGTVEAVRQVLQRYVERREQ